MNNLVTITSVIRQIGGGNRVNLSTRTVEAFIKQHKVPIEIEAPYGRGVMRMIRPEVAKALVDKLGQKAPIENIGEARELGEKRVLREAIDRLAGEIGKMHTTLGLNSQAIELLIKQNNLLTERLNKVLEELGCVPPPTK